MLLELIYIQPTEALTVIDVNSGKFTSSATQEETILKTNIEAVHEIARQLRLRNVGGMIIIDFIDMLSRANKLAVMEELEIALEPDKAKPQVGQLSDLGLVELTRHRQGQTLEEIFTKKCPHCQGSGQIIEEFQFSSSVAEGEYRSKAAKLKLPVHQFKNKNDKNNRHSNQRNSNPSLSVHEQNQLPIEQKEEISVEKLNEVIKDNQQQIKIADAVVNYEVVDKFLASQQEEVETVEKEVVAPVLTQMEVDKTDVNPEAIEVTTFNQNQPQQQNKKFQNKNNKQRRNNSRFNKKGKNQLDEVVQTEDVLPPIVEVIEEKPSTEPEQTKVQDIPTKEEPVVVEPVVSVETQNEDTKKEEQAEVKAKPKGKTRRATATRARSKKKANEQPTEEQN